MQMLSHKSLNAATQARPAARMPKGIAAPFTSSKPVTVRLSVISRAALKETVALPVIEKGELTQFPASAGVYAVYDKAGTLQYIGLSRKVAVSVAGHIQDLPDLTGSIKYNIVEDGSREALQAAWKAWVEEAVGETGNIPPGNIPGETKWQPRSVARATKPEIRLTAGKPIQGITIEGLIDRIVKENPVVVFVKGTRQQPMCGFSARMLTMLNTLKADFEVVNVLDEYHNPGLREAIKSYSQWPTIPQLYVGGEFVGGADIAEQMLGTGELQTLLRDAAQKTAA